MTLSQSAQRRFRTQLLRWYALHARDLPWRRTRNPYRILVSEMMLQQTQVDRVIPKYRTWLKRFPSLQALARATTKDVLEAWQGLGYNRRALYVHRIAQTIIASYGGRFPRSVEALEQLPGIGPYTACAIASFAFEQPEAIVDTNVKRVVGRVVFGFKKVKTLSDDRLWDAARTMLPHNATSYSFNQALMDVGSMICTVQKPRCNECPLKKVCVSYPSIQRAAPQELRYNNIPKEQLYFGRPRRIWRGRILRFLHEPGGNNSTELAIGRHLQKDFTSKRLPWLRSVLHTLEKDGMVNIRNGRVTISASELT